MSNNSQALGGNSYRWLMERIALGDHTLQQTIYACVYHSDHASLSVDWMPVESEGNARVEGCWRLEPAVTGTNVQLHTQGTLDVDFPGFLQFFFSPLIELAFT